MQLRSVKIIYSSLLSPGVTPSMWPIFESVPQPIFSKKSVELHFQKAKIDGFLGYPT